MVLTGLFALTSYALSVAASRYFGDILLTLCANSRKSNLHSLAAFLSSHILYSHSSHSHFCSNQPPMRHNCSICSADSILISSPYALPFAPTAFMLSPSINNCTSGSESTSISFSLPTFWANIFSNKNVANSGLSALACSSVFGTPWR